jgi:peptidoglycan hydrolase CwlO-like protein
MFKVQANKIKMKKLFTKQTILKTHRLAALSVILLTIALTVGTSIVPKIVTADNVSDQINQLQQENNANKSAVTELRNAAVSYQDAINRLQSQINLLQGQIDDSTAKQAAILAEITANEAELARQRAVLGENIRVMYVEGQISTIEMLATSKNLSEFVDKEEYRNTVKNKIQTTLAQIGDLQNKLKEQKVQVEKLLAEQQAQQEQLASSRAEQSSLLGYNQSQQSEYNQKTKANQAKIASLIEQQRRANNGPVDGGYYFLRFSGDAGNFDPGAYPYKNAGFGMSTAPGCVDNDGPDRWGYCTRQCVSYAAWAVEASGRRAPRYYGNAKDWVAAAYAAAYRDGVEVSRVPQPGDVAISTAGTWGHAMYVEQVSADKIYVSQYNANLNGQFSYAWRSY